ncbi:MAG: hypothetical protein IT557_13500 [Alphaproteobacteria bacterium]|nr:hypothetical protein [Alphaproteobacteria bacterium]
MQRRRALTLGAGAAGAGLGAWLWPPSTETEPGASAPKLRHAGRSGWEALAALALEPIRAGLAEPAPSPFRLLQSWETLSPLVGRQFDRVQAQAAFVYDNALAGMALLHAGESEGARRIGMALLLCQEQDRHYTDGRLRNAYRTGPVYADAPASAALPGWWDEASRSWREDGYHAGTSAGVMGWAMLLWLALFEATREAEFRVAALRAAMWIEQACADARGPGGYRGGVIGHEPEPARLSWKSTEHNIDIAAAFARLAAATGDRAWQRRAARARGFVAAMWRPEQGRFLVGTLPDGVSPNRHVSALDVQLWPSLLDPQMRAWRRAIDFALTTHGLPREAPRAALRGLDFDTDRDGIWSEGTAQAMLALRQTGHPDDLVLAARLAGTLLSYRTRANRFRATDVDLLSTGQATGLVRGEADFRYPRRGHLAVNAWVALAALNANPFAPVPRLPRGRLDAI